MQFYQFQNQTKSNKLKISQVKHISTEEQKQKYFSTKKLSNSFFKARNQKDLNTIDFISIRVIKK